MTTEADTGVISLPHSSGPSGVIVGKKVDECPTCSRLNDDRHRASTPPTVNWPLENRARREFHTHWEEAHRA
ncbi:hypothetical protein GCM10010319_47080 [Streptomyces blastmyceticus]|uniref:Uncharacterized protein n=1 Tax=Streptomyces blastmyceticus TaxID=68180 RepID=A0ABP3H9A3_9ACTN